MFDAFVQAWKDQDINTMVAIINERKRQGHNYPRAFPDRRDADQKDQDEEEEGSMR